METKTLDQLIEDTIVERVAYLSAITRDRESTGGKYRAETDCALRQWIDLGIRFREQRWLDTEGGTVDLTPLGSAMAALSGEGRTVKQWDADRFKSDRCAAGGILPPSIPTVISDPTISPYRYPNLDFEQGTKYTEKLTGHTVVIKNLGDTLTCFNPWVYGVNLAAEDGNAVPYLYPKRAASIGDLQWANDHVVKAEAAG